MAGWHHWLDGRESEWTLGVGDGQGGLVCCNSWGRKELDTTERLIWSDLITLSVKNRWKDKYKVKQKMIFKTHFMIPFEWVNKIENNFPFFIYFLKKSSILQACSSVQFSRSVVSDSLRPHESQHARPPCPSPSPGVHSNSNPLSQWCHPAISSSIVPFSSCPQSLPASESFPMSQLLTWGGQSTGVSALASFLPKITQGWSPYTV